MYQLVKLAKEAFQVKKFFFLPALAKWCLQWFENLCYEGF